MDPQVWLFDIDGVLVSPGGYRAAVRSTVNYFTQALGLGDLAPDDATIAIYEAQGITCEWDMVPITLARILDTLCARLGEGVRFGSLESARDILRQQRISDLTIEFAAFIRSLGQYTRPGEAPVETFLAMSEGGGGPVLFPALAGQGVLRNLFLYSRRPAHSRTTHIFETFVLGSDAFRQAMALEPEVQAESYLAQYDHPLLAEDMRERVLGLWKTGALHLAAYTARPSVPSRRPTEPLAVFAPEAEAALALVGLESIPLVGSGQVSEAALALDESEERLTKPAPYHSLAAIAAAWSRNGPASVEWMQQVFLCLEHGGTNPGLAPGGRPFPARLGLRIFEDSPSGIAGGVHAAQMLGELGVQVDIRLLGIAAHPDKVQALRNSGAAIFADVNQAVDAELRAWPAA